MERSSYQLRVDVDEKHYETVSSIVGLKPRDYSHGWSYEIILEEEPMFYDVIGKFLIALKDKFGELEKIGIKRNNISVWLIYAYNGQCNMEFIPATLKSLGDNGITLCISCYEAGV